MPSPVFFLSFANDATDPLPNLEKEHALIYAHLNDAANQQQIQIHSEQFATVDNVSDYLTKYDNRVSVFHYGGHADSQQLFLQGGAAYGSGLAHQLSQQESLKLVFLNGCSTEEQVRLLLALGIPAVIATTVDVDDSLAAEFAGQFYQVIANGQTIKKAFEKAAAFVATKTGGERPKIYERGLGRKKKEEGKLAWGLYAMEEEVLGEMLVAAKKEEGGSKINVVEDSGLEIEGNLNIGNKGKFSDKPNNVTEENVVKRSKIKVKKDFNLGNIYEK